MPEFEISKETKNPLFKRTEIEMLITSKDTPTKKQALEFLSKQYSCPEEGIQLESIKGSFGSKQFKIIARVYSSKEEKNLTEARSKKQIEKDKKEEESAKPEEKTAEIVEEPKEENKQEEEIK